MADVRPEVGSVWVHTGATSPGRRVVVEAADEHFVHARTTPTVPGAGRRFPLSRVRTHLFVGRYRPEGAT